LHRGIRVIVGLILITALVRAADIRSADEYEIKAAMLVNLGHFVEWPASKLGASDMPFVIGIVGRGPFGRDLDQRLAGKTIAGHPISIQHLSSSQRLDACHILFISQSESKKLDDISAAVMHAAVLTVGDKENMASAGSVVGFVVRDDRVQLEINLAAAQRQGLVISSRLLRIATVVKDGF
jgi:hypothetical protein